MKGSVVVTPPTVKVWVAGTPAAAQLAARLGLAAMFCWPQGSAKVVLKVCAVAVNRSPGVGARIALCRLARNRRPSTGAQAAPAFHASTVPVLPCEWSDRRAAASSVSSWAKGTSASTGARSSAKASRKA